MLFMHKSGRSICFLMRLRDESILRTGIHADFAAGDEPELGIDLPKQLRRESRSRGPRRTYMHEYCLEGT